MAAIPVISSYWLIAARSLYAPMLYPLTCDADRHQESSRLKRQFSLRQEANSELHISHLQSVCVNTVFRSCDAGMDIGHTVLYVYFDNTKITVMLI